jgi:uncharacterized membrane protein YfcA
MSTAGLICLGLLSGAGAGLLAGLVGIGGGIVVVPVVYYGLLSSGVSADQAAHVAVSTSLAAILPAAIVSSLGHWRAGNTDFAFLRDWGPGIAVGVVVAQFTAPHLRGSVLIGVFAAFCLIVAVRFAAPGRFQPILEEPPSGNWRRMSWCRDRTGFRFRGRGWRHHDEYRHELVRLIDAQKHRSRRSGGGDGRSARDDRGRIGA